MNESSSPSSVQRLRFSDRFIDSAIARMGWRHSLLCDTDRMSSEVSALACEIVKLSDGNSNDSFMLALRIMDRIESI